MGKRSDFPKIPRDLYPTTDPKCIRPLLPFLESHTSFAEPCCGQFDLIIQLERAGHRCSWASDIENRWSEMRPIAGHGVSLKGTTADALTLTTPFSQADCIITNPPFTKEILFPMIDHFRKQNFTWLLLNADFMHNVGSAHFMKHCAMVVSIGRVIWIPGTKPGKENFAWFKFQEHPCETIFIGRAEKQPNPSKLSTPAVLSA